MPDSEARCWKAWFKSSARTAIARTACRAIGCATPPPCVACRNALFEGRPEPLDDERRFDKQVRHNDIPVLALFHTVLSAESSALQSAFGQAAAALEPCARLASIDSAVLPDLTERLKVVRYPTLLLLYRERELARATGAMNLAQLLAWARPLITAAVTGPG
jgi:thioredoxin 2